MIKADLLLIRRKYEHIERELKKLDNIEKPSTLVAQHERLRECINAAILEVIRVANEEG